MLTTWDGTDGVSHELTLTSGGDGRRASEVASLQTYVVRAAGVAVLLVGCGHMENRPHQHEMRLEIGVQTFAIEEIYNVKFHRLDQRAFTFDGGAIEIGPPAERCRIILDSVENVPYGIYEANDCL
jgi:hypothetical protein